ncbi:MAG TPA: mercuric reductase [Candidatus Sulfotelmatobacter sp.]|jgi:pyruvate/2-oxoglutarate dehydrogenase complex dihydrolipoamide dehydrogenase (E3) component|nr:mercuric reductase [Candidatus Sulfotelmatobacter sp.]
MPPPQHYDAIVIGSGQGGNPLCQALANSGLRTALIEKVHVGGTCINEGCTPTKTMVAGGRVAYLARRGPDYGVHTGALRISMERVRKRKRDIVNLFRSGNERRIAQAKNLDLLYGVASFTGAKSIVVRTQKRGELQFTADRFFINAGCRPAVPDIPGLAEVPFLDSSSIMELGKVPAHLLVLGGGYVGLEFAQLFRRLGSKVTVIQHAGQLLKGEDQDIADEVAKILREDGLQIHLNSKVEMVSRARNRISVKFRVAEKPRKVEGTHLLVATGRVPNSDTLNLPAAAISTDPRGFIRVNEKLETSAKDIFALGDIKGGPAFTHISYDDFRILRTNLLEHSGATTANRLVPYTVFIDPQLGRIGLSETEARAQNRAIRVAKMPMNYVARAVEADESRGFLKAIVDANTNQILGAAILGIEGGEIMSQLQIAMMGQLPYTTLRDATFAHPTLAESLNNLFSKFQD